MVPIEVGVRELRDNLSKKLAEVKAGETITVTEHGRAVAQIVPVDARTRLEQLIADGRATPPKPRQQRRPLAPPIDIGPGQSVSEALIESRA